MSTKLLNHKEAADLCGLSQASFFRLVRHHLPAVALGPRAVRFRRTDVEAFIESRVVPSDAE